MLDCLAFDQSSTLEGKKNDAGTPPVLEQADEVWHFFGQYQTEIMNANVGVSLLDAETQL